MKNWFQTGGWLMTLLISAGMALQCAAQDPRPNRAQSRQENKPQKEQRQQPNQQRRQEQRQERRQPQQEPRRAQPERRIAEAPRRNAETPRRNLDTPRNPGTAYPPPRGSGNSRDGGNRPPNVRGESVQRPNFNENRPPNATGRLREYTP